MCIGWKDYVHILMWTCYLLFYFCTLCNIINPKTFLFFSSVRFVLRSFVVLWNWWCYTLNFECFQGILSACSMDTKALFKIFPADLLCFPCSLCEWLIDRSDHFALAGKSDDRSADTAIHREAGWHQFCHCAMLTTSKPAMCAVNVSSFSSVTS